MVERKTELKQENSGAQCLLKGGMEGEAVSAQDSFLVRSVIEYSQSGVKSRIKSDQWLAVEEILDDYHQFLKENYSQKRSSLPNGIVREAFIQTDENGEEIDLLEARVRRLSKDTGIRYSSLNLMTRSMVRMVTRCFANKCLASEFKRRRGRRTAIIEGAQRHSRPKIGSDKDKRID